MERRYNMFDPMDWWRISMRTSIRLIALNPLMHLPPVVLFPWLKIFTEGETENEIGTY